MVQVYKKVPRKKCNDVVGELPIKVRWIDKAKQDEAKPKYRIRLVAKEFKRYIGPGLSPRQRLQ